MNICETNRDGGERYVTPLKGLLDGCRFESLYWQDGKMIVALVDDETKQTFERMELKVDHESDLRGEYLLLSPTPSEKEPVGMAWDGEKYVFFKEGHGDDLKDLATWWIVNNVYPRVMIDGEEYNRDDEAMKEVEQCFLQESAMENFYAGDVVPLHDGLYTQSYCTRIRPELMPDQDVVKQVKDDYWEVETKIFDENKEQAVLQANVFFDGKGGHKLIISSWESFWEDDDLKPDILALHLRFLMNKFDNIKIVQDPDVITVDDQDVSERSGYWLGF